MRNSKLNWGRILPYWLHFPTRMIRLLLVWRLRWRFGEVRFNYFAWWGFVWRFRGWFWPFLKVQWWFWWWVRYSPRKGRWRGRIFVSWLILYFNSYLYFTYIFYICFFVFFNFFFFSNKNLLITLILIIYFYYNSLRGKILFLKNKTKLFTNFIAKFNNLILWILMDNHQFIAATKPSMMQHLIFNK